MQTTTITSDTQIQDMLDWALAGKHGLAVQGQGSKVALGRPVAADAILDMSGLTGVLLYEPAELVMKAKAGMKVSEVKALLDQQGQKLAFEPPDYGPLLGTAADMGTLGGIFSTNLSGSSRVKSGAARDHLLGVSGFTGRGQTFQTGSRVMKNVTGYDLCKLVAGSYGTLAIATEMTFKVLPKFDTVRTVLVYDADLRAAIACMRDALSSVHDVAAAAYLPAEAAARIPLDYISKPGKSVIALKIEGPKPSATFRCDAMRKIMAPFGDIEVLHSHNSAEFWSLTGNAAPFVGEKAPLWRLSVPPANADRVMSAIKDEGTDCLYFVDWAGGLIWVQLVSESDDGGEAVIRGAIGAEGHATLIRGSETLRRQIAPFQPVSSTVAMLNRRIKNGFDPENILNPGRMYLDEDGQGTH
ncbi:FAD-binding protein [Sneathiella marina]|uniref:FAD-binding protein n=1 Tax=Sneathiella marina TaxID=2950108 RepID=A0ABY4W7G7_9PROT|nr:FAD-binding protein [Sneathiella marina]USG62844.1 FAD-binding protein [Sneathiella marina]